MISSILVFSGLSERSSLSDLTRFPSPKSLFSRLFSLSLGFLEEIIDQTRVFPQEFGEKEEFWRDKAMGTVVPLAYLTGSWFFCPCPFDLLLLLGLCRFSCLVWFLSVCAANYYKSNCYSGRCCCNLETKYRFWGVGLMGLRITCLLQCFGACFRRLSP